MYDGAYNRTCKAIELQHEDLQIDQFAELLGQFSCKKMEMLAKVTTHVCWRHTIVPVSEQ